MNQYHVYEKIGSGQNSLVYKGRKKRTILYYAVKSVDKREKPRVLQEVRAMHNLEHRNILRFFTWYETQNHLWLILEYCVGGDMRALLKKDLHLPESSIHDFGRDLLVALQYLHSRSIIYCDLKPSNILLDENGKLKLGGFGLSQRLSEINTQTCDEHQPAARGSPHYMAPELFQHGATHSIASDMWSFGCILYEMNTGRPPFLSTSFKNLVKMILNDPPDSIPGASDHFAHLISRLLDKNPATRMGWEEIGLHPFWEFKMPSMEMPKEDRFDEFIEKHKLRPRTDTSEEEKKKVEDRAAHLRESVNVMRLSQIVRTNLETENENSEFENVAEIAKDNDIKMAHADAELDFQERHDEGVDTEEEPNSPTCSDSENLGATQHEANRGNFGEQEGTEPETIQPKSARRIEEVKIETDAKNELNVGNGHHLDLMDGQNGHLNAPSSTTPRPLDNGQGDRRAEIEELMDLMWHPTDCSVKPIMGNRRIEKLPEPKWEARSLPFTPLSVSDLADAKKEDLDKFYKSIVNTLTGQNSVREKMAVLSYIESLVHDTSMANVLVNSCVVLTFLKIVRESKTSLIRVKVLTAFGILIRHATYVTDDLANHPFVEALTEVLRDGHSKVRCRAMACLGELLFYIASQQHAPQFQSGSDAWKVSIQTVTEISRLLKSSEEGVVKHYAVKAIENIASKQCDWVSRFSNQDVIHNLHSVLLSPRAEPHLKSTAASTISRLLRNNRKLVPSFVEKYGLRLIMTHIMDSSNVRLQTVAMNVLNMALCEGELNVRTRAWLLEDKSIVPSLVALMDHSIMVLRIKSMVCLLLLCHHSTRFLVEAISAKFVNGLERLSREKTETLINAMKLAKREIGRKIPHVVLEVSGDLDRLLSRKYTTSTRPSCMKSTTLKFECIQIMVVSPLLRDTAISEKLIGELARLLETSSSGAQEFQNSVLNTLEAICQYMEVLVKHWAVVVESLLPTLASILRKTDKNNETRFQCLRLVHDILQCYVLDVTLYAPHTSPSERENRNIGLARAKIDSFVQSDIVPRIPNLLRDVDLIPLFTIKVLCCLLENNPEYIGDMERLKLFPDLFRILSYENTNNSVHSVKLCRYIIEYTTLPTQQLREMHATEKVVKFLDHTYEHNVEQFFEPVLELCLSLVRRDVSDLISGIHGAGNSIKLLKSMDHFIDLMTHPDGAVALASAQCIERLATAFPMETTNYLLTPENVKQIVELLASDNQNQNLLRACPLQQQILCALLHVGHSFKISNFCANSPLILPLVMELRCTVSSWKKFASDSEVADLAGQVESAFRMLDCGNGE